MGKKQVAVSLRKPPPADPDAFVAGSAEAGASSRSENSAEGPTLVTRVGERREVTVYLPTALARELSVRCLELDRDVSSVVAEALVKSLAMEPAMPEPAALPPVMPAPAALPPYVFDAWSRARALVSEFRARLPLGLGAA
jgi:hypothetical protein